MKRNETTLQVLGELAQTIGMTKSGKAKFALFAEDAARFVRRLQSAHRRDHEKYLKIRRIVMGGDLT